MGSRIRRLRRDRGMRIVDLARAVTKPEGGHYSLGYISRIERGWASATLYAYVAIAAVLDVDPGKLLGPDNALLDTDAADLVLLEWMRGRGLAPHDVLLALTSTAPPPLTLDRAPAEHADDAEEILTRWEDAVGDTLPEA